jgi:hypothetical protein
LFDEETESCRLRGEFKAIKNLLLIISVEEIVSDFEKAVLKAVKKCFPGVHHFGCSFHWKQGRFSQAGVLSRALAGCTNFSLRII